MIKITNKQIKLINKNSSRQDEKWKLFGQNLKEIFQLKCTSFSVIFQLLKYFSYMHITGGHAQESADEMW